MLTNLVIKNDQAADAVGSAIRDWQAAVSLRDRLSQNQPCSGSAVLEAQYREAWADMDAKAHLVEVAQAAAILAAPGDYSAEQIAWATAHAE